MWCVSHKCVALIKEVPECLMLPSEFFSQHHILFMPFLLITNPRCICSTWSVMASNIRPFCLWFFSLIHEVLPWRYFGSHYTARLSIIVPWIFSWNHTHDGYWFHCSLSHTVHDYYHFSWWSIYTTGNGRSLYVSLYPYGVLNILKRYSIIFTISHIIPPPRGHNHHIHITHNVAPMKKNILLPHYKKENMTKMIKDILKKVLFSLAPIHIHHQSY